MPCRDSLRAYFVALVCLICGTFAQGVSSLASEEPEGEKDANLYTSPADVRQGQQGFRAACSRCHGRDARGAKGPDLTDGVTRRASTDEEMLQVVINGIPGTGMPGFGVDSEDYFWPIISYLRAEQEKRRGPGKPEIGMAGNVARGLDLFTKHKCLSCHWTGFRSQGGRRGTDLSRLAATKEYVTKSLTNPNAQVEGDYQLVTVVMKTGKILTGHRLHENTYYLLLMDQNEDLHTVAKTRIEQINRPHQSLMPTYQFAPQDVRDLTAYIFTLQQEPPK